MESTVTQRHVPTELGGPEIVGDSDFANHLVTVAVISTAGDFDEDSIERLARELDNNFPFYELIIIQNQIPGATEDRIDRCVAGLRNTRVLIMAEHQEFEVLALAALDNAIGDYVVLINIDEDDPHIASSMVRASSNANDAVVLLRYASIPLVLRVLSFFFYGALRVITGSKFVPNTSKTVCLPRRFISELNLVRNRKMHLKMLAALRGHSRVVLDGEARRHAPRVRQLLNRLLFYFEILSTASTRLLKLMSFLSLLGSFASFTYLLYALTVWLVKEDISQGWFSLSVILATMFGLLLAATGVIGAFLIQLMNETERRQSYFVSREVSNVDLFRNLDKLNIEQ